MSKPVLSGCKFLNIFLRLSHKTENFMKKTNGQKWCP